MTLEMMKENKTKKYKLESFGVRHTILFMCFLGYVLVFTMRVCLSVSIVAMVSHDLKHEETNDSSCPYPKNDDFAANSTVELKGEFDWDEKSISYVLGAFYYSYTISNSFGGRAADYWGGRKTFGLSVVFTSLAVLFNPVSARSSIGLFIAMRVLQGLFDGLGYPGINSLIVQWSPIEERSKYASFIYAGCQIGTVIAMAATGWICSSPYLGGWPTSFYLFGSLGIVWGIFWFALTYDEPTKHPRITDAELKHILQGNALSTKRLPVPWTSIFMSKYFWIIGIIYFGSDWIFYTLIIELPTYFDKILHIDLNANGIFSSLPFIGAWLFSILFTYIMNYLASKNIISLLSMRRISMVIGGFIPMAGLIFMCFVNCNPALAITTLVVVGTSSGAVFMGFVCSPADISPNFAGTLSGLTNTIANISGFISPIVTALLINYYDSFTAWKYVFLISAAITGLSTTIYIIFITTDVQPWNDPEKKPIKIDDKQLSSKNKIDVASHV